MKYTSDDIALYIEIPGVYDGTSVYRLNDGRYVNRWADGYGDPLPGMERRWRATQDWIDKATEADI